MSDFWAAVLTPVMLDAICVLGLYIIASAGRISVAQAAFFGIGAYAAGLLAIHTSLHVLVGVAVAAVIAAIVALIFAAIADPLEHWFFAIATLALGIILQSTATNLEFVGGALGLYGIPLEVRLPHAGLALVLTLAVVIAIDLSPFGRSCRAIRDSPVAASAVGIPVRRVRIQAFAIGSGIAGASGALWAYYLGTIRPSDLSFDRSLSFLIYLSIGGSESVLGGLVGTAGLGILPEFLRFSSSFRFALYGGLLVVVMVFRPSGIVPRVSAYRWTLRTTDSDGSKGSAAGAAQDEDEHEHLSRGS